VKCAHESAGKKFGTGGAKMGHGHVKGACSDAAGLFLRHAPGGKKLVAAIEKQHDKGKPLSILAHTIGRAVCDMLSRGTVFSMDKFHAASRGRQRASQTSHSSHAGPSSPRSRRTRARQRATRRRSCAATGPVARAVDGTPALFAATHPRSRDALPLPRACR